VEGRTVVAAAVFENVHKSYTTHPIRRTKIAAVRGVSFGIPRGTIFGLLGPNRAGKTTLVKMLLSLAKVSEGSIHRLGEPIASRQTLGRVGYMHENHAFPRYLSASDVLHFYGGLSGLRTEELPGKVDRLLERVGLADRRKDPISQYSKGMVQRLGLAQAIMNEPDLLILDEPTEGLDLMGRKLLREVVRETKKASKTVLLVSHVLPEVEELCEQAVVVVAGKLAFEGKLNELSKGGSLEAALQSLYEKGATA
jgi:ABC-2 type transport system ATP-binding protein